MGPHRSSGARDTGGSVLVAAARHAGSTPRPYSSTVLDLLRDETTASRLKSELTQPSTDEDAESYLHDALGGLIGCLLVQGRRADWRLEWAGEGMLTGTDFTAPELPGPLWPTPCGSPRPSATCAGTSWTTAPVPVDTPLNPVYQPTARAADAAVPAGVPRSARARAGEAERPARRLRIAVAVAVACAVGGILVTHALTRTSDIPPQILEDPAAATISDSAIYGMAFSPDGKNSATGDSGGHGRPVEHRQLASDRRPRPAPQTTGWSATTFSSDSDMLAVAIDSKIYLWNRATAKLDGHASTYPQAAL